MNFHINFRYEIYIFKSTTVLLKGIYYYLFGERDNKNSVIPYFIGYNKNFFIKKFLDFHLWWKS